MRTRVRTCEHDDVVAVDLAHTLADQRLLVLHAVALIQDQIPAATHARKYTHTHTRTGIFIGMCSKHKRSSNDAAYNTCLPAVASDKKNMVVHEHARTRAGAWQQQERRACVAGSAVHTRRAAAQAHIADHG